MKCEQAERVRKRIDPEFLMEYILGQAMYVFCRFVDDGKSIARDISTHTIDHRADNISTQSIIALTTCMHIT